MSRWMFSIEQDGIVVASGEAPTEVEAKMEAGHYAIMYSQDGTVKVSVKEVRGTPTLPREGKAQDDCEVCHGTKGGVPGNENIVDGKVICDYCHAEHFTSKAQLTEEVARIDKIPVSPKLEGVKLFFKKLAGEREDWKNSMALSDAWEPAMFDKEFAVFCHTVGVKLNRDILVRWGLDAQEPELPERFGELPERTRPSIFDGMPPLTEEDKKGFSEEDIEEFATGNLGGSDDVEAGGAAGEDRRTVEAVSKCNDGVESGAVGVGEKKGVDG